MKTVGAFEAKTHLSSLLEEVESGQTVTITKHGKPVAKLVPMEKSDRPSTSDIIEAVRSLNSRSSKLTLSEILELRHEGHRF
ncbi:MAG TPA: type II toxin-antitoxin system prevent-host-death family antitoxin [Fimbriimonadaceae bacterium]|nr:type II toxin-antitoxin system prevent-host-death family antitoxin [Fimbriimonadaceae bacterium]